MTDKLPVTIKSHSKVSAVSGLSLVYNSSMDSVFASTLKRGIFGKYLRLQPQFCVKKFVLNVIMKRKRLVQAVIT